MHDEMQPLDNQQPVSAPAVETDHEGAMAKADLYKLANYSLKLFKQINDGDQLEAWVQAKITKSADYIASVYHYLEYEMKFSEYGEKLENSDVYSESQKLEIKNKLTEAKEKIKALKVTQAEKIKEGSVIGGGKEEPCPHCGGAGHVVTPGKVVPDHVQKKVEKYKTLVKATKAAHKRLDANKNGIPDDMEDKEVDEDFESLKKTGDTTKTSKGNTVTKTATGIKHERPSSSYDDGGDDLDTMAKSGKGTKSHAKAQSAAEKKDRAPAQKKSKSGTWGMEGGEKFDNRKKEKAVGETYGQGVYAEGKKPDFLDMDKDGDKKEPMKKAVADKKKNPFAKKVKEGLKGGQKKLDADKDGDIEADDLAALRAKRKKNVEEGSGQQLFPQDMDGATAPPPKGKDGQYPIITAGPNKGKRWTPQAPGPTNPAIKESEVVNESSDLTRLKELTQKLLG